MEWTNIYFKSSHVRREVRASSRSLSAHSIDFRTIVDTQEQRLAIVRYERYLLLGIHRRSAKQLLSLRREARANAREDEYEVPIDFELIEARSRSKEISAFQAIRRVAQATNIL